MGMPGLGAQVQTLTIVPHRRFEGPLERRVEMDRFQQGSDKPDAPLLFLLSTRVGGLGINLTAAMPSSTRCSIIARRSSMAAESAERAARLLGV